MTPYVYPRISRAAATLAALSLVAAPASSQQIPTAEQVLARHEAAVGGKAALDAHSSVRMKGVIFVEMAEIRGSIETIRAKPNKFVEKLSLSQIGDMLKGYDGKTAWVLENSEPGLLTDIDAETVKRLADWHHEFMVTQAMRGARVDSADYEGERSWQLTYASGLGDEVHAYFSRETGFRIAEESKLGVGEATTTFGEYKSFGGVQFPTRISTRRANGEMLMNILSVEFDKVPASAFDLPPAVKAIAK